jgi:exoribonuclease R
MRQERRNGKPRGTSQRSSNDPRAPADPADVAPVSLRAMRRRIDFADGARLAPAFAAIRSEEGVPERFPPDVLAEAEAAARAPRLAAVSLEHIPFVTLDPPGAMDLDQAFHLERLPDGHRVRYAIADVGAFVAPGGALDREAAARARTIYCPDRRITLYPPVLSEGAASLLPDGRRPAVVWTIDIDRDGLTTAIDVRRASVRSRARLDYPAVQAAIEAGTVDGPASLLREVGEVLVAAERARGGMTLRVPSQEVKAGPGGRLSLEFRSPLPAEDWNAQLSLLTGRAAAQLMLDAHAGILRTMPPAEPRDVERLRRIAAGLGIDWPAGQPYGAMATSMEATSPSHAAFLNEAGSLFRGAGYVALSGTLPELTTHAAIAAPYAHCTAPLRRLVDRFVSETCLAIAAGRALPDWTLAALPLLPAAMDEGTRRATRVERASIDLVEAAVLRPLVGERFDAVVVGLDGDGDGGEIVLPDLAVIARCAGRLPLGHRTQVTLEAADPAERRVRFRLVSPAAMPGTTGTAAPA